MEHQVASRLDLLDFTMKSSEGRQDLPKWRSSFSGQGAELRQSMPLDLAVREAYFKGSLMDRVAFLERRLFQLTMELDQSSSTSGQASKSEQSSSLPISDLPNQPRSRNLPLFRSNQEPQPKEMVSKKEQAKKIAMTKAQKHGKKKAIKEDEVPTKMASSKWPLLRILGC